MSTTTGQLYIVSAPSGAGKSSLLGALRSRLQTAAVAVSHTTRPPRPGEVDGQHYHFVAVEAFRQRVADGDFLEHAQVFDNYYGTSHSVLEAQLQQGLDVSLDIDWQGARQVRERVAGALSIFILPPSLAALEERLRNRQQDSEATIQRRMRDARSEISHYPEYDYLIVNDDFVTAVDDLVSIFRSGRLRRTQQMQGHGELLQSLVV